MYRPFPTATIMDTVAGGHLYFGLEFEFYVRPVKDAEVAPDGDTRLNMKLQKEAVLAKIANGIQSAGLNAAMELNVHPDEFQSQLLRSTPATSIWKNLLAMGNIPINGDARYPGYSLWVVKDGGELIEQDGWIPVECSSPTMCHIRAANDTERALQAIVSSAETTVRLCSPAFHVHVNQTGGAVSLKFVKRVATIVYAIEDEILWELVRPFRRRANGSLASMSSFARDPERQGESEGLKDGFQLLPNILRDNSGRQMRNLWGSNSLDDLEWQLRAVQESDTRTALALARHEHPNGRMNWTIEFRHAQSSLQNNFFKLWMGVVLAICKISSLPDDAYSQRLTYLCNIVQSNPTLGKRKKIELVISMLGYGFVTAEGIPVPRIEDWNQRLDLRDAGLDPDVAGNSQGNPVVLG